jgi:hypothetical protein
MPKSVFRLLALLAFYLVCLGKTAEGQVVISRHFPGREDMAILCWSIPEERGGYQSQIVVFQTDTHGTAKFLWQSFLGNSYAPQIRFVEEITVQGLPLALVERQTGAASSQLDVIGKVAGRIVRLLQIDGFKFDVVHLGGSKLPFIIAHTDASVLDVPDIYRWTGRRFEEDSAAHSDYYRQCLAKDKSALPEDSSAVVLVNLARIAVLSGDRTEAKAILTDALSRERSKGDEANEETLRLINKALHALEPSRHAQEENPHPKI